MNILFTGTAGFLGYALVRHIAKIKLAEEPKNSILKYVTRGLYFTDNSVIGLSQKLSPTDRGELEEVEPWKSYFKKPILTIIVFERVITWMDSWNEDSLYAAGKLISIFQKRLGLQFAYMVEIAWRNGLISDSQLIKSSNFFLIRHVKNIQ